MTHQSDLAAAGAAWDQAETDLAAAKTGLAAANAQIAADAGIIANADAKNASLQAALDAANAAETAEDGAPPPPPPPPPPPVGTALYGASILNDGGSAAIPATVAAVKPQMIRFYNPGPLTGWAADSATACPNGIMPFTSAKWAVASLVAKDPTTMTQVTDWLTKGPKKMAAIQHEADNPKKGIVPVDYVLAMTNVMTLPQGNTLFAPTIMAWSLDPGSGRNADDFYIAAAPVIGFDCYGHPASSGGQDTREIDFAAAYAAKKGKPWVIPELGYQAISSTANPPSDLILLAWMQKVVPLLRKYAAVPGSPLLAVSWMNHGAQALDPKVRPLSTAYWGSVH